MVERIPATSCTLGFILYRYRQKFKPQKTLFKHARRQIFTA